MQNSKDSLTINQNKDGTFTGDWDKNDPNWKFLNNLTSREIQGIIETTMKDFPHDVKN